MPDYIDQLAARQPADAAPPIDFIEELARQQATATGLAVRDSNPEQAAQANKLGRSTGLDPAMVERNLPAIQQKQRDAQMRALLDKTPKAVPWALDRRNVAVAQDDWNPLTKLAKLVDDLLMDQSPTALSNTATATGKAGVKATASAAAAGGIDLATGLIGVGSAFLDPTLEAVGFGRPLEGVARSTRQTADAMVPQYDNPIISGALSGVRSIPASLVAGIVTLATKSPGAGAAVMGATVGGSSYLDAKDEGLSDKAAAGYAAIDAGLELGTEYLGNKFLLGDVAAGSGFLKTFARQMLAEIPTEQLATLTQDFNRWAFIDENKGKTFGDYLDERPNAAIQTAVATLVTGGSIAGLGQLAQVGAEAVDNKMAKDRAKRTTEFLQTLIDGAGESKTRQRDLDVFEKFLAAQVEGTPAESLYIDAEKVRELYQKAGVVPGSEEDDLFGFQADIQKQLEETALTGGDVVINLAAAVANLPDSKVWDQIKPDIKLNPAAASMRQAAEQQQDFQAAMEATLETQIAAEEKRRLMAAPTQAVFDFVVDKLDQKFPLAVRKQYAALWVARYEARAERLGITVEQAFKQAGIEIKTNVSAEVRRAVDSGTIDSVINEMQKADTGAGSVPRPAPETPAAPLDEGLGSKAAGVSKAAADLRNIVEAAGLKPETASRSEIMAALTDYVAGRTLEQDETSTTIGWTPERLDRLIQENGSSVSENYSKAYAVMMSPQEFLDLTLSKEGQAILATFDPAQTRATPLDLNRLSNETQTPFLIIDKAREYDEFQKKNYGLSGTSSPVYGHEGRHRAMAMLKAGIEQMPVVIINQNGTREIDDVEKIELIRQSSRLSTMNDGVRNVTVGPMIPINQKNRQRLLEMTGQSNTLYQARLPVENTADSILGARNLLAYLTAQERADLKARAAEKLVAIFDTLPTPEETAAVALAGRAKRGWYETSALAILDVFGAADAPRFAALLAALSPQRSVESNLYHAVGAWAGWLRAGRPTDRKSIVRILGDSAPGSRGIESVLDAWINNSVIALATENPSEIELSGPKVDSFMWNLQGVVDEVTNDAWMMTFAALEGYGRKNKKSAGKPNRDVKSPGYVAYSAMIRKAAQVASEKTGEAWTPAEVQETVWSFTKALYEGARAGDETMAQFLERGGLTHDIIADVPDFAQLLSFGVYGKILEGAGYGNEIAKLGSSERVAGRDGGGGSVFNAEGTGFSEPAFRALVLAAANRIETVRAERLGERKGPAKDDHQLTLLQAGPAYPGFQPAAMKASATTFTKDALPGLLDHDGWAILTAENPDARDLPAAENEARQAQLRADLEEAGYEIIQAVGKYGNTENPFIILGIDQRAAQALCIKYSQQSVLTRQGLVYQDGSVNPATGMATDAADRDDFYTIIPETGVKFAVDIDFDTMLPPAPRTLYQVEAPPPFYSALEKAVEETKTTRAPAAQWAATLKKTAGVKAEELEWSGILDWLDGVEGQVERDDVLAFVRENGVRVSEVVRGGPPSKQAISDKADELWSMRVDFLMENRDYDEETAKEIANGEYAAMLREAEEDLAEAQGEVSSYETYTLPGGTDYTEFLLTLPPSTKGYEVVELNIGGRTVYKIGKPGNRLGVLGAEYPTREAAQAAIPHFAAKADGVYNSGHFDTPNIVAHFRVKTRIAADGKRVLFVEEVQSDWHQAGRDKGYKVTSKEELQKLREVYDAANDAAAQAKVNTDVAARNYLTVLADAIQKDVPALYDVYKKQAFSQFPTYDARAAQIPGSTYPEAVAAYEQFEKVEKAEKDADLRSREALQALRAASNGIPDAPFKKSWPALAMKRIIRYAADHGYDRVAWTSGQDQIERYDLAETLERVGVVRADEGNYVVNLSYAYSVANGIVDRGLGRFHSDGRRGHVVMSAEQIKEVFGGDLGGRMVGRADEAPLVEGVITKAADGSYSATQVPMEVMLDGVDLQIGGEGMKGFYDRNLVNITNDILKKSGGRVEMVDAGLIRQGTTASQYDIERARREGDAMAAVNSRRAEDSYDRANRMEEQLRAADERARRPGFDITDALRDQARGGFALFQQTPEAPRGSITISGNDAVIRLFESANLSTFLHESGHLWLEELRQDAARPDAPEQIKQDWARIVDWFTANGHPLENGVVPVEAHEMWARGFERFLMEGKAPSNELKSAFRQFSSWLLRIYQVVANLRSPITPEIREVMGRMLATDEQIDRAMSVDNIRRLFLSANQAGMSEAQFAAYVQADSETRSEAFAALLYRTMKAIERRRNSELAEERDAIRQQVEAEVNARPINRAMALLRRGRLYGDDESPVARVQLSKADLVERYGDEIVNQLPKGVPPIIPPQGGVDADTFAEMTGFDTGDAAIRALVEHERAQAAAKASGDTGTLRVAEIERLVDEELTRRYGDPLADGTIEQEALAAIHNDQRATVIASEVQALGRMRSAPGAVPTTWQIARDWAEGVVLRGIAREQTSAVALQRHAQAERKAAKLAEQAMLAGDVDEAYRQKQQQLFSHAMYRAAKDAKDKVEAAAARLEKLAAKRTIKSMDQDYLDRIHQLLERYDFKTRSTRAVAERESFADWAAAKRAAGEDVFVPKRLEDAERVNYSKLTVAEILDLDHTASQLAHLGRKKKRFIVEGRNREFAQVKGEGLAQLASLKQRPPTDSMEPTATEKAKSFIRGLDASLLKMETLMDWLDGGNPNGWFNRVIWRRIAAAQVKERDMMADYGARFERLLGTLSKAQVKSWSRAVSTPNLINRVTGQPWKLTKQHLIAAALNTGNEGNLQRLLDGYGWTQQNLDDALDQHLTAEDWAYVQGVWDIIGTLWPEISEMERRLNGALPEKVEARTIVNRHGTFAGGYYPAVYDPTKSTEAQRNNDAAGDRLFENSYLRATTRSSSVKDRADKVNRPILLSLTVISRHVGEVIHDIAFREAIIDSDRMLSDKEISAGITNAMGPEYSKLFRPWLQSIANEFAIEGKDPTVVDKLLHHGRTSTTMVGLGFRISTILMQFLGFSNTAEVIGPKWLAVGIAKTSASPVKSFEMAMDLSGEMRSRFDSLDRDIRDNVKAYAGGESVASQVRRFAFYGIGYADRLVTLPTWIGGYNRALSEGMSEADAIQYADKAVRASQGSGSQKDLSAIMRSSEGLRLLTVFYSYFNALYARQRTLGRDITGAISDGRVRDFPLLLARSWWLLVLPTLGQAVMSGHGPDDDEDWGLWAIQKMMVGNMGSLPLVRDVAGAIDSGFGYKFSPVARAGESITRAITDVVKTFKEDEEPSGKWLKNGIETAGYVFKLPTGQLAAAAQFLKDVANEDQDPETIMGWYRGLTTGKAEPRSEQ